MIRHHVICKVRKSMILHDTYSGVVSLVIAYGHFDIPIGGLYRLTYSLLHPEGRIGES